MEEKIEKFLEYLEGKGIEICGETAFKCDDGIVLFVPNENRAVDITLIRKVVEVEYVLGITDNDVELFSTISELVEEMEE